MIKPIKDKENHQAAIKRIEHLMSTPTTQESTDEIEVLATLIEKYERETIVTHAPSPVAAIKLRMEQKGLSPREFGFDVKMGDVGEFLSSVFGQQHIPRLNRKTRTQRASAKTDQGALLIWQAAVLKKALRNPPIGEFSQGSVNKKFLRSIAELSAHPKGPVRAVNELSKLGIIVVILPVLPGTFLDGAVMLLNGKTPVIGLTLRHDRVDNFWFTLLHELSHLAQHFEILSSTDHVFFDELDIETDDEIEAEADKLAKNSLIPSKIAKVCKKKFARTEEIEKAGEEAGVHVSIVAGRWQRQHGDYKKFSRLIERNTVRDMLQSA